jgi:hypothetical protein
MFSSMLVGIIGGFLPKSFISYLGHVYLYEGVFSFFCDALRCINIYQCFGKVYLSHKTA